MLSNIKCDICGDFLNANFINREGCSECTQHYCSKCGYQYETGFRYNLLIKQFIRYVRFNP